MQKSRYTIIVPHRSKSDHFLAYNTRTQAIITISHDVKDAIDALPDECRFKNDSALLGILYKNGIVVKDAKEDAVSVASFYQQIQERPDVTSFEVILLTTFQCNFACSYCFEANVGNGMSMSEHTCDAAMAWIQYQIVHNKYKAIHVTFYGGEPLMNKAVIHRVAVYMKKICKMLDVAFSFGMITNGYLLNEHDIDEWIPLGLTALRVTVDGDQSTHDSRRVLKSGCGTFSKIIKNIESIIEKQVKIEITGNYDRESFEGVISLLDYLEAKGLLSRFSSVGFNPVLPRLGSREKPQAIELTACMSRWDNEYFDLDLRLRSEMKKRGAKMPRGLSYVSCSMMSRHNGVLIAPDGIIYKCPAMVGHPQFSVGTVLGIGYNDRLEEFVSLKPWEKCDQECPYLPLCNGGCRFMAYARDGHFHDVWCPKKNIDRLAEEMINDGYVKYAAKIKNGV